MKKALVVLGIAALLGSGSAFAASVPTVTGAQDPSQLQAVVNGVVNSINNGIPGYSDVNADQNYLDNGAMLVNQRGAAERVGGTTSGPTDAEYGPDRWAVDTNVTSGAGYSNEVTSASGVTFAPGFTNMVSVYRKTGALTQPVCLEQEIKSSVFSELAGRSAILSAYIAKNAGAASAATAKFYLWTGTGTDEGLGVLRGAVGMTASTALTPALTGLATAGSYTTPALTVTATRYSSAPIPVASTATEGVFAICFTPGAETAGTTDGILVTGAQLEGAAPKQTTAGNFNRVPYSTDLARAQRYFAEWSDSPAATFTLPGTCTEVSSGATAACTLMLPQPQDLAAPVDAVATATSFGMTKVADGTAEACTTLAVVSSSNNPQSVKLTCAVSETAAVGTMHLMLYAATGAANTITVNSDF